MLYLTGFTRHDDFIVFDTDDEVADEANLDELMYCKDKGVEIGGVFDKFVATVVKKDGIRDKYPNQPCRYTNSYTVLLMNNRHDIFYAVCEVNDICVDTVFFNSNKQQIHESVVEEVIDKFCDLHLSRYIKDVDRLECLKGKPLFFANSIRDYDDRLIRKEINSVKKEWEEREREAYRARCERMEREREIRRKNLEREIWIAYRQDLTDTTADVPRGFVDYVDDLGHKHRAFKPIWLD